MKLTHYIYISAAVALFTACSSEDDLTSPIYTVGEADNAITLCAGISEGAGGVQTRAGVTPNSDKHVKFAGAVKLRLRVDGTWTGHDPVAVTYQTVATIKETPNITTDVNEDTHAIDTYSPKLYWDDYGTADPANIETPANGGKAAAGAGGREKGLTIYGVAVNDASVTPPFPTKDGAAGSNWTNLSWNVGDGSEGSISQTGGWSKVDLLSSNNVVENASNTINTGTYKFDNRTTGKRLDFTHMMSKVTVELTAGDGFENSEFVNAPEVKLLGFYYKGSVNVEDKTNTPNRENTTSIEAYRDEGVTWTSAIKATFTALVFPGNAFNATGSPAVYPNILEVTADGNKYFVTSEKLIDAIDAAIERASTNGYPTSTAGDYALKQGWNYLLKVKVNKTAISVTATVVDWETVTADEVAPKINVTQTYGVADNDAFAKSYTLFRSTNYEGGYNGSDDNAFMEYNTTDSKYNDMNPQLYWPDHNTHYFFRGVYPYVPASATDGHPALYADGKSIAVTNGAYTSNEYPSDLMIGIPRNSDGSYDETCKVHTTAEGICATEGKINLNFRYVMSQVEVRLTTSGDTDPDHVNLANAKVEVIGGYTDGKILISDGSAEMGTQDDFEIKELANDDTNKRKDKDGGLTIPASNVRHNTVIPQDLTNVKFRITIYKSGSSTDVDDVYECAIKDLLKNGSTTEKVTPEGKWLSGKHYIYFLDIRKTAINVVATLTNWTEVTGSTNVWF